jgi:hypothetical protein
MILPCVGSKLREGSGLSTPDPAGRHMSQQDESAELSQEPRSHMMGTADSCSGFDT